MAAHDSVVACRNSPCGGMTAMARRHSQKKGALGRPCVVMLGSVGRDAEASRPSDVPNYGSTMMVLLVAALHALELPAGPGSGETPPNTSDALRSRSWQSLLTPLLKASTGAM